METKQLIGEEHSLVQSGKAVPLEINFYNELIYRRALPLVNDSSGISNVKDFNNGDYLEKLTKDKTIQEKAKVAISKSYEKLHGENNLLPISFLRKGSERSSAVCRVVTPEGFGTGFLIEGGFLMTNNHVVDSKELGNLSYVEFFYEEGVTPIKVSLDSEHTFITNVDLDYTIIGIEKFDSQNITPIELNPSNLLIARDERVSIIQHPRGREKEVALQDNKVSYVYDKVVHYRTDTEPGTSGSPVFNKDWDLVALHHAGWYDNEKKESATNEGILISAIVENLHKVSYSDSVYRESSRRILNTINESSPVLGFFDVHGLVESNEVGEGIEVEIPSYRRTRDFVDIGFWNIEHFNNNVSNRRISKVAKAINT